MRAFWCLVLLSCAAPAPRADVAQANAGTRVAGAEAPHLWPWRTSLTLWRRPEGPLAPRDRVDLYVLLCSADTTVPSLAPSCRPTEPTADDSQFVERLVACFDARVAAPPPETLQRIEARWREPRAMQSFEPGERAFAIAHLQRASLTDEVRGSGCDGPRRPNMGCDPVVIPTGRKVRSLWTGLLHATPQGWADPWLTPVPPPELFWIHLGPGQPMLPEPAEGLAALEAYAGSPEPDVQAAVLVDTALLRYRQGDLERGAAATRKLRALVEEGRVNRRMLALDVTLQSLERIAAGELLLKDPCTTAK